MSRFCISVIGATAISTWEALHGGTKKTRFQRLRYEKAKTLRNSLAPLAPRNETEVSCLSAVDTKDDLDLVEPSRLSRASPAARRQQPGEFNVHMLGSEG